MTLRLILSLVSFCLITTTAIAAQSRLDIKQDIIQQSRNSLVPVDLALAVAKVESDFNARALSSAGARGVMQIMPATARHEFQLHPDRLWDSHTNIQIGLRFLEDLYHMYDQDWDRALSHYNGGSLKNGRIHSYTKGYIQKVKRWQRVYKEQATLWAALDRRLLGDPDQSSLIDTPDTTHTAHPPTLRLRAWTPPTPKMHKYPRTRFH